MGSLMSSPSVCLLVFGGRVSLSSPGYSGNHRSTCLYFLRGGIKGVSHYRPAGHHLFETGSGCIARLALNSASLPQPPKCLGFRVSRPFCNSSPCLGRFIPGNIPQDGNKRMPTAELGTWELKAIHTLTSRPLIPRWGLHPQSTTGSCWRTGMPCGLLWNES